ncbi:MAG: hypothetical protein IPG01_10525 [Chitinophagaceae bacterium]|nr:hypothetical protein [Chitinophagaceae bacterium]
MKALDDIVQFYLKSNTNYALMITGDWGIGKTFYLKNTIFNQIASTPIFENNNVKYKPHLISLFGLKSIEEIQTEILLSIYPFSKNKAVKVGFEIAKALAKGFLALKNLNFLIEIASETEINKKSLIKFAELVICFDDLERINENLKIDEFIGYVNSLVENQNIKVIIVANENKIDRTNYFNLKEKVVGNCIEFIQDLSSSYESLINNSFAAYRNYMKFLTENKKFILETFKQNSSNLRTLHYALFCFHQIYSELKNSTKKTDVLKQMEGKIFHELLKFTITISIEYKSGNLSSSNKKALDQSPFEFARSFIDRNQNSSMFDEKKQVEKSYREQFMGNFYKREDFHFYNSIYFFLTGGSILEIDVLINELNERFHIEQNKILPQYILLEKLAPAFVFSQKDNEYKNNVRQMLIYCDQGFYSFPVCLQIFYYASRFENPLRYNLATLQKRIINGMKKSSSNQKYTSLLDDHLLIDRHAENYNQLVGIRDAIIQLNEQLRFQQSKVNVKKLEMMMYSNFNEFIEEFNNDRRLR